MRNDLDRERYALVELRGLALERRERGLHVGRAPIDHDRSPHLTTVYINI